MDVLRAKRVSAHYRMPSRALTQKPRLDRILQDATHDWLGEALDREGFGGGELICLRRVRTRLRIKLSSSDENIAAQWALQVAEAVRIAAESGSPDVVRYRSRGHAVADLIVQTLDGNLDRQWAWQQLGIVNSSQPGQLIVQALRSEPTLITPVIVSIAEHGRLSDLLSRLSADSWFALAELAWQTFLGSPSSPAHASVPEVIDLLEARAVRILQNSTVVQIAPRYRAIADDRLRRALAIFALLESEPSAALQQHSREIVATIESKLAQEHAKAIDDSSPSKSNRARSLPADTHLDSNKQALLAFESRFGGLFLLVRLFAELDLFAQLDTAFPARSLPWTLQQLALRLASAGENDPAVLAFAGRRPSSASPSDGELAATPEENQRLSDFVATITSELDTRLPDVELHGAALRQWLCQRWCRIEADPGWFQICFSLSDVSTDIRRAALDLDPGYLRWLGVTVVFRYE